MVISEDRIWKNFYTPEMSQAFEKYFAARGVIFAKSATVKSMQGDGSVSAVELGDGRSIACDLVVAGIGVQPVTAFLAGNGIETGDGVMVNEFLETNISGVFAAGDVANYPDLLFGKRRRVEHWDNAVSQGQHCARTLMGQRAPFRHVPYFFSDVFDLSYEFWGDPAGAEQVVHRGDLSGTSFSAWWLRNAAVVAAFVMNRPDEERNLAPQWIESRHRVSAARLGDASKFASDAVEK
jgi:NADPH-dependent 2,4-dienoyl-CoA reductase/sulfur reductase-like enzyme